MRLQLNAPGGGRRAAYAELRLNPRIRYVAAALPAAIAATCLARWRLLMALEQAFRAPTPC